MAALYNPAFLIEMQNITIILRLVLGMCGMMQPDDIKKLIEAGLVNAEAFVEGDGAHFTAVVICSAFLGKSRLQKQQLVYDTVRKELLNGTLHALSVQTFTPEEWQEHDNTV